MTNDPIVQSVKKKMESRSAQGMAKFGCYLDRMDKDRVYWLRNAQEEAMDLALYLEKLLWEEERGAGSEPGYRDE
ncbi:MAG TPA: hypothetical protein DHW20_01725 [Gemmatimonadetes bacterium]|nr:hypothetical protein [Gemmatimonadota bacterium]|tara:strand:+ start:20281 stop:20505 length:225 start_codon:yes stop_codon:yes gene_type:complete